MPDTNSAEDVMSQRLKNIFQNPQAQAKAVDLIVHNKPLGWSRRANAPYYKELYGKQMLEVLDKMMENKEDVVWHYVDFCKQLGITQDTLYTRINQSLRYLFDKLDTADNKYKKFYERCRLERQRGTGIVLHIRRDMQDGVTENMSPRKLEPTEEIPKWKKKVDEFLTQSKVGEDLCLTNLALYPDQITQLRIQLAPLTCFFCNITSHTIKIVHINPEA